MKIELPVSLELLTNRFLVAEVQLTERSPSGLIARTWMLTTDPITSSTSSLETWNS